MSRAGSPGRHHSSHVDAVAAAKAAPGRWVPASSHGSLYGARSVASCIRRGTLAKIRAYRPGDQYDAEARLTETGAQVWIKYVGERTPGTRNSTMTEAS